MTRIGVSALVILIICLAASAAVRVRVVDPSGRPLPSATVTAGGRTFVTGADGIALAEAVPPLTIRVAAAGFQTSYVAVEAGQEEVTAELSPEPVYSTVQVVGAPEELTAGPMVAGAVKIDRTGVRTVFDAVDRLVPSAFVTRRGVMGYGIARGGTGQVSIRGVGNSPNTGVLVVIDGRPDYMGMMGHPLPDFYSLPDAASVTVYKGPASVLYGSNAMGGVIDIRPADPVEGFHTELSTSLGSYWTGQYRLKHGAAFDRWFYHVTAGVDHTNGHRPASHFRNQDGTLALGRRLTSVWRTTLRGRYGHFVVEDPGPVGRPPGDWASVGRGGFSWNFLNDGGRAWGALRAFGSWGHHHISDGWRSNDRTVGARIHEHFLFSPGLMLEAGGDLVDYGGQGWNVRFGRDFGRHFGTAAAGFGRLHWNPAPRLTLLAGFRGEHNSIFGGIAVPEFQLTGRLSEAWSLGISVARGFRNPTIRELYLFPAPNPALEPERLWHYELSFQFRPTPALAASVAGFYADLDNMIVVQGRWPSLELLNAGRTLNRGLDADVRWRVLRRLTLTGGYAYLRSTNRPPYLPAHKAVYGMELSLGRLFLYAGGVAAGARWADLRRTRELGGYVVPSLKATVRLSGRATAFAVVDNWIDEDYQVVTGYPMPGINAAGGFTFSF